MLAAFDVVLITHDMSIAARVADHVADMRAASSSRAVRQMLPRRRGTSIPRRCCAVFL